MRIIFLNRFFSPDHSATSQMLSDLAFHLASDGFAVHVITSGQGYDAPHARLPAREELRGVGVHRTWSTRFGRRGLAGRGLDYLTFYLSAAWRLQRLARGGDILVAMTDPPLLALPAGWLARRKGARLVNWIQDLFPEVAIALRVAGFQGRLGRYAVRLRNRALDLAACNVVLGSSMAQQLIAQGVPQEKIAQIANWADAEQLRPLAAEANPLRQAWGLQSKFVVGYSGNLGRAHGYQTLLQAAQILMAHEKIRFLFIGGGVGMERLAQECCARGLQNVLFRPYQPRERLRESLGVADIHLVILRPELEGLVLPSKIYGIGAAGRPLLFIGAPDGELGQLVRDESIGVGVAPGDGQGLADILVRLSKDAALLDAMGARARHWFERDGQASAAFEKWEALLRRLAEG